MGETPSDFAQHFQPVADRRRQRDRDRATAALLAAQDKRAKDQKR